MTSQSVKLQIKHGTLERNQCILKLYESGLSQAKIARQFTVNGRRMSRQRVNQIITRSK